RDYTRPPQPSNVVRVHRLIQLEHDVIGGVYHVIDGANADGFQSLSEPGWRRADFDTAHDATEQTGAAVRIVDSYMDATCVGAGAHPADRWNVGGHGAGNGGR